MNNYELKRKRMESKKDRLHVEKVVEDLNEFIMKLKRSRPSIDIESVHKD